MSNTATPASSVTATGKQRAAYTMLGHFKQRSVAPDGGVLDKWTWRGDSVIREYAKQNRAEKNEVMALLTKLLETYHRLTTVVIYDNQPGALNPVLVKIVSGIILINNLTGAEASKLKSLQAILNKK